MAVLSLDDACLRYLYRGLAATPPEKNSGKSWEKQGNDDLTVRLSLPIVEPSQFERILTKSTMTIFFDSFE